MDHISYFQAVVIGLLQGVTELFPISSLGHSILVPAWIGGSWTALVTDQSKAESPYLAFIVALHVATALALVALFWRDWVGIVRGFFTSLVHRRIETTHERLAWLIVVSTIPAGLLGLVLEHPLRTLFAKPLFAAVFLTLNGLVLFAAERLRRRAPRHRPAPDAVDAEGPVPGLDVAMTQQVSVRDAGVIGLLQSGALLAGISRSGITMAGGLLRGLTHEEAVRFAFLLATPIILAAGVLKVPDLMGPLGEGIRAQSLAGAGAAFVAALAAATFLQRWFKTRTLTPFAVYCLVAGVLSIVRFA
ncbi:undecaprenyl-diphosphate phosphatase [Cellulomonas sp. 73-145]|uniref:undecaprenyl-diphosphate phosphatase n=1 Tax=unclassified Cellulomonas TaxID=2620175 RepID=UPI000AD59ADD|nr:undecaprenyl-diphosphate phosphatase [Cellulomonas sp. 73-145]MBN9326286.1 undecaprenyl-diphosphate phosphatase [Cellulomonas sp.]